jgi:hypothetical protein
MMRKEEKLIWEVNLIFGEKKDEQRGNSIF